MKTRFLLALLSATILIPATAMAQDAPELRSPRARDRMDRIGGEAPRPRGEFNGGVRVQAPEPRVERPRGDSPRWEGRPDRNDRNDRPDRNDRNDRGGWDRPRGEPRPDPAPRRDPPRDAQGQIDREQLRRDWQRDRGNGWQGERQAQQRREQQRREWQRDQQRRDDWNRNDGGWARSGSDWRDNDRYRGDWNDRRQWNRDWRSDNRYDWNRYRDSNRSLYRLPRYYGPQGYNYGYRRFGVGVTLNPFLFGQNYWINDPFAYRLPDAYGQYRWVRYYNDALLVDLRTGRVVDVEYDIFW